MQRTGDHAGHECAPAAPRRRARRSPPSSPTRAGAGAVTPSRTSVTRDRVDPLAASLAMKVELQSEARRRRLDVIVDRRAGRRPTTVPARGPCSTSIASGSHGNASAASAIAVQAIGRPGRTVHPSDEQQQRRRRQQAAPQVVEDLPAGDERQAIARHAAPRRHEWKQPPQDLPVAAHPAVLPPRVGQHAGGIVVHDLDVGDERRARVEPLEQVVREQRVLRARGLRAPRRTRRRRRGPCR